MMGFGMGLWSLVGTLLFWVLLVIAAIWLVKLLFPSMPSPHNHNNENAALGSADEVLKIRYARGELSEAQYNRMRQMIQK